MTAVGFSKVVLLTFWFVTKLCFFSDEIKIWLISAFWSEPSFHIIDWSVLTNISSLSPFSTTLLCAPIQGLKPLEFFLELFQGLRINARSICQPVLWGLRCLLNFSFIWFQGLTVKKLKVAGSVAKVSL